MNNYTRNDAAADIAAEFKLTNVQGKEIITFLLNKLSHVLAEDRKVEFRGFGIIVPMIRKVKLGRNPKNPSAGTCSIPARRIVKLRIGKELDAKLNTLPVKPLAAKA